MMIPCKSIAIGDHGLLGISKGFKLLAGILIVSQKEHEGTIFVMGELLTNYPWPDCDQVNYENRKGWKGK